MLIKDRAASEFRSDGRWLQKAERVNSVTFAMLLFFWAFFYLFFSSWLLDAADDDLFHLSQCLSLVLLHLRVRLSVLLLLCVSVFHKALVAYLTIVSIFQAFVLHP